jgi:hypothetical protein
MANQPAGLLVIKAGSTAGDERKYGEEIATAFRERGWTVKVDNALHMGGTVTDLWIKMHGKGGEIVPPAIAHLAEAMIAAGLPLRPQIEADLGVPAEEIWLSIGSKK